MSSRERLLFILVLLLAVIALAQVFVIAWLLSLKIPTASLTARANPPASNPQLPTSNFQLPTNAPLVLNTVARPTANPSPTRSRAIGKKGERITSDQGYAITLNDVRESQGTNSFKPRAGDTLLLLNLTVENSASNQLVAFNSSYFHLTDSSGNEYHSDLSVATPQLATVLPLGRTQQGWLTFEIPDDAQGLVLVYQSTSFTSPSEIQIELGR